MNSLKRISLSALLIFLSICSYGQAEMADTMRSEGKIYVVVAIILIVLAGIFAYLFSLDKKVKKLEDEIHSRHGQTK